MDARILKTMFIDITENRHFKVAPLNPAEGRNEQAEADQAREQRISQRQPPPKAAACRFTHHPL